MIRKDVHYRIRVLLKRKDHNLLHLKSIKNFAKFLFQDIEPNRKSNIKKVGVIRKKELLLEYLDAIEKTSQPISKETSSKYFTEYVHPIGRLMSSHFGFTLLSLRYQAIPLLIGYIIGYLIEYLTGTYLRFSLLLVLLIFVRFVIKFKQGKIFGFNY